MKKPFFVLALASLVSFVLLAHGLGRVQSAASVSALSPGANLGRAKFNANYGQLPLHFEANYGQTDARVRFLARGPGYGLFLTAQGATLRLQSADAASTLRLHFVGAQTPRQMAGRDQLRGTSNYFLGSDPTQWRTQVPHYAQVEYKEIYPGIDVVYYGQQQQLEYDFIVAPHANPHAIRLQWQGAKALRLADNGDLVLQMPGGEVRQHQPVAYQIINGQRRAVAARYEVRHHEIRFRLGAYDRRHPLVIDPVLVYATYLGGSNSETGRAIAVDKDGNAYIVGETFSNDFPGSSTIQPTRGQLSDAFLLKLNAAGTRILYATWLGGDREDQARNVTVDADGNAYVIGTTGSGDFPTTAGALLRTRSGDADVFVAKLNATGSALLYSTLLGGNGGETGFDLAVDANGNAYVTGSTFSTDLPATGFQTTRRGNSLYKSTNQAGSWTGSNSLPVSLTNSLTFDPTNPNTIYAGTASGAYKSTDSGANWQRLTTFLGLSSNTYQVAVHPMTPTTLYAGVAGGLFKSTDGGATWMFQQVPLFGAPLFFSIVIDPTNPDIVYTGTASGVYKTTNGGTTWAGVNNGIAPFPGSGNLPQVNRLVMDRTTPATLYAATVRGFFKTTDGGANWNRMQQGLGTTGGADPSVQDVFADSTTPTTLYARVIGFGGGLYKTTDGAATWSLVTTGITLSSGAPPSQIVGLALDPTTPTTLYGSIPGAGVFKSTDGGTTWNVANSGLNNLQVSFLTLDRSGVLYAATNSGSDGFVAKLNPTGSALGYLTYLGGDESDTATAIAVDKDGNAVVTGVTSARNFPTLTPFQAALSGGSDVFVTKLNSTGTALLWSTYLGGTSNDNAIDLALNASGQVFLTGTTLSGNFPTVNPLQAASKGGNEVFISKLRADGSGLEYSTYLGGTRADTANALGVDSAGNVYVTGATDSQDFPLADAVQAVLGGGTTPGTAQDAFVAKLNPNGSALVYSTYLGGSSSDAGFGLAVDTRAQAYVTGSTSSPNFPTVNPLQALTGSGDLFVAKLGIETDLSLTQSQLRNPVMVNNQHTYRLTATNNGPSPATGVTVTDALPVGVTFVSATASQGNCTHSNGTVTCQLGALDKQGSATITLVVTPANAGKINHTPVISGNEPDSNQANNRPTLETTVSALPSIGGRVTAANGSGLANVTLTVNSTPQRSALTDSAGYYQIAELPLGSNVTITPTRDNYSFEPAARSFTNLSADQTANFAATVCAYEIFPTTQDFTAAGGAGSFSILATARCPWTAVVNPEAASWLKVPPDSTGTGNGAVTFTVAPTTTARSGRITIGGQTFTIYQNVTTCSAPSFGIKSYFMGARPGDIKTADFNGDGRQDLAVALRDGSFNAGGQVMSVVLLVSEGNGTFRELTRLTTAGVNSDQAPAFVVGDFNGDQRSDMALFNPPRRRVEVYTNDGTGQFSAPRLYNSTFAPSFVADVNGDGKADLLAASGTGVSVMLNQSDGFGVPYQLTLNGTVLNVADFTGDGLADVLTLLSGFQAQDHTLMVYPGDGIGSFRRALNTSLTAQPSPLLPADINNDGHLDIVYIAGQYQDSRLVGNQLGVRLNDGTGRFPTVAANIDLQTTRNLLSLAVADFNGDARPDALVTDPLLTSFPPSANDPVPLYFYPGDGTGKLGARVVVGDIRPGVQLVVGNFDDDGRADLVSFYRDQYVVNTHLNRCASSSGLAIAGRVTESDLPVGFRGTTLRLSGSATATTQTDSNGNYEFNGLTAGGNYTVTVERGATEFAPSSRTVNNLTSDQRVDFVGTRVAVAVSAASYARGAVAPESIVSVFGQELSEQTEAATSQPLPTFLGNVQVTILGPSGYAVAPLLYVSPTQVNFVMPPQFQLGEVTIIMRILKSFGSSTVVKFQTEKVSPALFSANASGSGAAAGNVIYVTGNTRRDEPLAQCTAQGCTAREIDVNAAEEVYLELYGTGLRNFTQGVTATLGGAAAAVTYAGKQNDFAGLDQINLRVPKALATRGEIEVVLTVDGKPSNAVRVKLK